MTDPSPASDPIDAVERRVAQAFARALRIPEAFGDTDFFAAGGDELLFARTAHRLLVEHGAPVVPRQALAHTTVRRFARLLTRQSPVPDAEIDLPGEAGLPVDFAPLPAVSRPPAEILLTGATGFLGVFLLNQLLAPAGTVVHCLIRARDAESGWARLHAVAATYGLDLPRDRIEIVVGDLAAPDLGLAAPDWHRLAARVDTIVHSAAQVNFVYPYRALRAVNVAGTREVLRFATTGASKAVHHLSTIDMLGAGGGRVPEGPAQPVPVNVSGYVKSKWVAETMMRAAADRGLPVSIYRPWVVLGHSVTGAAHQSDFTCAMLKGCIQLGAAPELPVDLDVMPVDYLAGAIGFLVRQPVGAGAVYQFANPRPAPLSDIWDWVRDFGYPIEAIPLPDWLDRLRAAGTANALGPALPILDREIGESAGRFGLRLAEIETTATRAALRPAAIECPPVSRELTQRTLGYLVRTGFLPPTEA